MAKLSPDTSVIPTERNARPDEYYHDCSFPPAHLEEALAFQQRWQPENPMNNEMVLDTRSVEAALPGVVLAFFYRPSSEWTQASEQDVRSHRQAFLRRYGLSEAAVPLVRCDMAAEAGVLTLSS